jgi:uncharacterized membrane protein YiaA
MIKMFGSIFTMIALIVVTIFGVIAIVPHIPKTVSAFLLIFGIVLFILALWTGFEKIEGKHWWWERN